MIVFATPLLFFTINLRAMVEILCYITKEKQGFFGRSLASSGQVSMPTSNFNQT